MSEWRDVVELAGYQVSEDGRVKSLPKDVPMKTIDGKWMTRRTKERMLKKLNNKGYICMYRWVVGNVMRLPDSSHLPLLKILTTNHV